MEAMGKEEKRETCEPCPLHFRVVPEKPGNHPSCSSHSPHQELWIPRSISSPSALHSKEHYPHFMAGSTCQPGLGAQGCWTLSATVPWHRECTTRLGVDIRPQHSWSLLLRWPCGWNGMWYEEALWMNQLETLPWLRLPYNPLCCKP